jgi:hypothetical protein
MVTPYSCITTTETIETSMVAGLHSSDSDAFRTFMAGGADFSLSAAQGRLTSTRVSARGRAKENR